MIIESFTGSPAKMGTAGGFLTVLIVNLSQQDILRTMVLSFIGACISFAVSMLMKKAMEWWKR